MTMDGKTKNFISGANIFVYAFILLFGTAQLFLLTWNIPRSDTEIIAAFCYISALLIGMGIWCIINKGYLPTIAMLTTLGNPRSLKINEISSSLEVTDKMIKNTSHIVSYISGVLLIIFGVLLTGFIIWLNFIRY
jgi:hypothetical protein